MEDSVATAKDILSKAEALLVTAGAGMGVDSGLPDFRGNEGFWNAYPPYRDLGFEFIEMANPERFVDAPELCWGFYGHRLNLYRGTAPHEGFQKLKSFGETLRGGSFGFTSNVDGHFEVAGFPENRLVECHGSIRHLQCFRNCQRKIWPVSDLEIQINESTMRALDPLPLCPDCDGLARPAILMFGDLGWNPKRTDAQEANYAAWLDSVSDQNLVIIEIGAGTSVPTVRLESEQVCRRIKSAKLIRINTREPEIPEGTTGGVSLPMGGLEALELLFPKK